MQISDVIADMLTRIRNANAAKHENHQTNNFIYHTATCLFLQGMYFAPNSSIVQIHTYMLCLHDRSSQKTRTIQRPLARYKKNMPLSPMGRQRL